MRLSQWPARAPHKESMAPKLLAVLKPVLTGLGAKADPCWVAWGDDPTARYTVLVPTPPGLIQIESVVLRGMDEEADAVAEFALQVYAAIDRQPTGPLR